LFGTESYLQIDVLQAATVDPEVDANPSQRADEPPATRAAELRTIVYTFEELRDTTLTEPRMLLTRREMNWEMAHPAARGSAGRRSGQGRLPMPGQIGGKGLPADAPLEGFDEKAAMSVPEVMQFRLRYFDGNVWSNQWDSVALKRLPVAVEVAMHLRSFDEPDPVAVVPAEPIGEELGGLKPKLPVYRLVIQLPDTAAGANGSTLPPGRGPRPNAVQTLGANANARP
jgi:type II secretion system (T2SS) protein J